MDRIFVVTQFLVVEQNMVCLMRQTPFLFHLTQSPHTGRLKNIRSSSHRNVSGIGTRVCREDSCGGQDLI